MSAVAAAQPKAEEKVTPDEDAAKEQARLNDIMKRLALAKAKRAEAQAAKAKAAANTLDPQKFGTHLGITCDGCGIVPIVGYRWRCRNCKNHDLCDTCIESFNNGKLLHTNGRRNPISPRLEDHEFDILAEPGIFKAMKGASGPTKKKKKKLKPNQPCPGGCGKKVKKCQCKEA